MFRNIILSFITNNAKGIQSYKKRLKLIQYLKEKIGSTGVLFLQEAHSSSKVEQKWKEYFKGHVFFSHEKNKSLTQQHSPGFIQRGLDYIFISNTLQELVTTTEMLIPISANHSPVIYSLSKGNDCL